MDSNLFTITQGDSIATMLERMRDRHVAHVVVMDGNTPIGLLTERDLVRLLHGRADLSGSVGEFMSRPVAVVRSSLGFSAGYTQLCLARLRHLVVIDAKGNVVGVAAERDFFAHLGAEVFQHLQGLRGLIDRTAPCLPAETPMTEAIEQMIRHRRGCILVAADGKYQGIFTEEQIPSHLARHTHNSSVTLADVMRCPQPVEVTTSVAEVAAHMVAERISHAAVVGETGNVVGTLSQTSLLERIRSAVHAEIASQQLEKDHLQKVEAQLRATLQCAPHLAIQWYDREGRVRFWNRASENIYGYTASEAMGKTMDQLIPAKAEADDFRRCLQDIDETRLASEPTEYQIRNRQGDSIWVETMKFVIPGNTPDEP
jgi:PAS domain S-box-containing protein